MVAFRSKIHENPELGFEEFEIRILKLSLTRWASLTNTQRAFFLKKIIIMKGIKKINLIIFF